MDILTALKYGFYGAAMFSSFLATVAVELLIIGAICGIYKGLLGHDETEESK